MVRETIEVLLGVDEPINRCLDISRTTSNKDLQELSVVVVCSLHLENEGWSQCPKNFSNESLSWFHMTNVSSTYLNNSFRFNAAILNAVPSKCSKYMLAIFGDSDGPISQPFFFFEEILLCLEL